MQCSDTTCLLFKRGRSRFLPPVIAEHETLCSASYFCGQSPSISCELLADPRNYLLGACIVPCPTGDHPYPNGQACAGSFFDKVL